jgi:hypothetical protein
MTTNGKRSMERKARPKVWFVQKGRRPPRQSMRRVVSVTILNTTIIHHREEKNLPDCSATIGCLKPRRRLSREPIPTTTMQCDVDDALEPGTFHVFMACRSGSGAG